MIYFFLVFICQTEKCVEISPYSRKYVASFDNILPIQIQIKEHFLHL